MSSAPTLTRQLAQDVLVRVARDAAYAERVLHTALDRATLESRDRALVTELVYGTLRHLGWLDRCLEAHTRKPLSNLPVPVLAALRLGAYQLLCMDVPAHSAVNESVGLVRRYGKMTGVVNAILRRVDQNRPAAAEPSTVAELAEQIHLPAWLLEEVAAHRGFAGAVAWARANNERAPVPLRINRTRSSLAQVRAAMTAQGITVEPPVWTPPGGESDTLILRKAGAVKKLPGFSEGWFSVQDLAASVVGHLANPQPGQVVLDACSAPGGKATHVAELMQDQGLVVATDVHEGKARLIADNAARLGLSCIHPAALDATNSAALGRLLQSHGHPHADVVILDAPCSGLGTARRNPEVRSKRPGDCTALAELQARLLDSVAPWVKPGGVLVYAVCTLTRAEGPEQIAQFLARHPEFSLSPLSAAWDSCQDNGMVRTWTDVHQADSFFAARLQRATP